MGENTKIEWATHTFNPWCEHCYAERDMDKRLGRAKWGPAGTRRKTSAANWAKPLKWAREAEQLGQRQRVFCASLADVFEDWQGAIVVRVDGGDVNLGTDGRASRGPDDRLTMNDLRRDLFQLIDATPWLDWLLVTKRPENIRRMWPTFDNGEVNTDYRHNCWLLTSISTQADAGKNIPELLKCRDLVPVLGVSAEPLLGPVELGVTRREARDSRASQLAPRAFLDWLIVGGESGPHARPMHPEWARGLRDQCQAAGVPFFFKQWGEFLPFDQCGAADVKLPIEDAMNHAATGAPVRVGKAKAGRLLDGSEWNEFPEMIR